ncbi:beta-1,4 N-acetylgalactosaminyltransferase 2-like isoform X4 [Triplophysa dalaica]|uniref:beta-1,4 N-acetylgalactosaminyltransferase 2-like isoform X4 n=1 Tax=Triplophysa dalaica TaxID=1582913 RepID=UPI0024E00419|nr:beta-1,4 N-acetylgalactosaminyltransferase 2-like isoform X4 [Triplophysa dalaica]
MRLRMKRKIIYFILIACLILVIYHLSHGGSLHVIPTPRWRESAVQHIMPLHLSSNRSSCDCEDESVLSQNVPSDQLDDIIKLRKKEYKDYLLRMKTNVSIIVAPANSPLQYPISGFTVAPQQRSDIPGLALHTQKGKWYKVTLRVDSGVLAVKDAPDEKQVNGQNKSELTITSANLPQLNNLLSRVTYTSTIYHIRTSDLVRFSYENHKVTFPILIRRHTVPVLYNPGNDINSLVTIATKTFLRYKQLHVLLKSIRRVYPKIKIIIADDSLKPESISGDNIEQYIMPPAQVGGVVGGDQFHYTLEYVEGDDGGCLKRFEGRHHSPLPGHDGCFFVDVVVNFFLARTDAVRRVGFDPFLKRVAHTVPLKTNFKHCNMYILLISSSFLLFCIHTFIPCSSSEFFIDGIGKLMVVSCKHLSIGHQTHEEQKEYDSYRNQRIEEEKIKLAHHYFKNYLKCMKY